MAMRKTSVYLTEAEAQRLSWLAKVEGRPQSAILRAAVAAYEPRKPTGEFTVIGSGRGPGSSVADLEDEELLEGFGEERPAR